MGFMHGIQFKSPRKSAETNSLTSWLRQQSAKPGCYLSDSKRDLQFSASFPSLIVGRDSFEFGA